MKFNELVSKMKEVEEKKLNKEGFYSWLDENLKINSYLPLYKKYVAFEIIQKKYETALMLQPEVEELDSFIYMEYEVYKLIYCISLYTNLTIDKEYYTSEIYDLIKQSGLIKYLTKETDEDINFFLDKCDVVTGINNIYIIKKLTEILSVNTVEDWEKIEDIINNGIDEKKLKFFTDIEAYNNPQMHNLFTQIKNISTEEARNKK